MKKLLLLFAAAYSFTLNAQTCGSGGCSAIDTNATGKYPAATFTTASASWSTVSAYMNAGNYTLFSVTSGQIYEWSYCSDFGGSMGWNAELTLFNNATGAKLCYNDNCGRSSCSTAPYIRWTATFTGTVKLLTTVSGCTTNTGSPYSTLVWRDSTGAQPIRGVDVYSGNSTINWVQVKAAGYTFAYAKATEGVGYTDSKYVSYTTAGETAGMKMGAYHFARPDLNKTNQGAINEANYFLSVAQQYITACQLPPALDLEGSYLDTMFTSQQMTDWVQNWMTTVQNATGIKPVLYIGSYNCGYVKSSLNVYPLWRDDLSHTPPSNIGVWTTWALNQYSWTATVPGISGSQTDVNIFNGNQAAFNTFMGCNSTGIDKNSLDIFAKIYPNPAHEMLNVELLMMNDVTEISLFDVTGRMVKEARFENQATALQIDISNLENGVYFIRSGNFSRKIIVQH